MTMMTTTTTATHNKHIKSYTMWRKKNIIKYPCIFHSHTHKYIETFETESQPNPSEWASDCTNERMNEQTNELNDQPCLADRDNSSTRYKKNNNEQKTVSVLFLLFFFLLRRCRRRLFVVVTRCWVCCRSLCYYMCRFSVFNASYERRRWRSHLHV